VRGAALNVDVIEPEPAELFAVTAFGLEAGALWKPAERSYRVGASASLPIESGEPDIDRCQGTCLDFTLPSRVVVPWQAGVGFAVRKGPTPWNRRVESDFRDERSTIWALDVLVTGKVKDGYGLEAFARNRLQPSGRRHGVSVRGGVEYEWAPGRFRVRGGSYWEPSRFKDPAGEHIPGRLHLTAGFDFRLWSFSFWGDPYRLRLSMTVDSARRYGNGGLSIGFWN
jgi:hypothetical protein